jgi:hypothetical protein
MKLHFVFVGAIIFLSVPAHALAGEITGRQYLILGAGPRPIADNEILVAPCAPINVNCKEVLAQFAEIKAEGDARSQNFDECVRSNTANATSCIDALIDSYKQKPKKPRKNFFPDMKGIRSFRTDFEGKFRLSCPAKNCMVFSMAQVGLANATWLLIIPGNGKQDLATSNAVKMWNSKN